MRGLTGAVALLLAVLPLGAGPAAAHDLAIGQARVEQVADGVALELALPFEELAAAIGIAPVAGGRDADPVRLGALDARRAAFAEILAADVRVRRGAAECPATLTGVDLVRHRQVPFAVAEATFACAAVDGAHELRYDLLFDAADHVSHAVLVDYDLDGRAGQAVLEPAARILTADGVDAPAAAAPQRTTAVEGGAVGGAPAGSTATWPLLAAALGCLGLLAGLARAVGPRRAAT